MLIGIIEGDLVTRIGNYREIFSNVSFPITGPSDSFLASNNAKKVSVFKEYNRSTEKLVPTQPYIEGDYIYTVEVADKTQEEIDAEVASKASQVREMRDRLLARCDWTQLPDSPLDTEKKAEWATYRQALRDLSEDPSWPDVSFPNDPDYVDPEE